MPTGDGGDDLSSLLVEGYAAGESVLYGSIHGEVYNARFLLQLDCWYSAVLILMVFGIEISGYRKGTSGTADLVTRRQQSPSPSRNGCPLDH